MIMRNICSCRSCLVFGGFACCCHSHLLLPFPISHGPCRDVSENGTFCFVGPIITMFRSRVCSRAHSNVYCNISLLRAQALPSTLNSKRKRIAVITLIENTHIENMRIIIKLIHLSKNNKFAGNIYTNTRARARKHTHADAAFLRALALLCRLHLLRVILCLLLLFHFVR